MGLLVVNLVLAVGAVLVELSGKSAIDAFETGLGSIESLEAFDAQFSAVAFAQVGVYVLAAIAWVAWQSRTIDNEDALGIGPSPISPRRSIGWWFIPFANLVMPYRSHRDIDRRYSSGAASRGWLVPAWWTMFIVGGLVANGVGRLWEAAETIEEVQTALTLYVVSDALTIVTAVLAITMIREIQSRALGRAAVIATQPIVGSEPDVMAEPSVEQPPT